MDRHESLFHEFGRNGVSKQQLELIAKTIASSPKLNHEITRAIDAGDIGRLGYVDLYPTEPLDLGGIECIEHISVVIDNAENQPHKPESLRNSQLLLQPGTSSMTLFASLRNRSMARLIAQLPFDTRTLGCAILCLGLVACGSPAEVSASAPQTNGPASLSSPKAQSVKDTPNAPASAPKLSKKEFEEKLFALIQGIQAPDDLSKARVEALTQLQLVATEVDGTWDAQGYLESGSPYSFGFNQYAPDDKRVVIRLPDEKQYDPHRRRSCIFALTALHDKLKATGYQDGEFPGPDNKPQAWQYWKDQQSLLVDYTYHATSEESRCIHSITIEMIIKD